MPFSTPTSDFDWAVVGAGPAGIAAVGKLLDAGVSAQRLAWIDPTFTVGDFGQRWRQVSSNTTVALFLKYLQACRAFHYEQCKENFALNAADPAQTCYLQLMVEPLQWVTDQLGKQVFRCHGLVKELTMHQQRWQLLLADKKIMAKNVVLAIGAEPKTLAHAGIQTISLETALNQEQLAKEVNAQDTIAVFGSSHSAIIILRHLLACDVKKIINFYREPLRYAVNLGDEILFDDTGLKGATATWARENLHGDLPEKLHHVYSSPENNALYLPECNKAIYAVGFQRRGVTVPGLGEMSYNPYNGIIAPGLFGLGIAFPQAKTDRFGNLEYRVGLWKFMDYLSTILPVWMRYPV
jgi:cation diffusion facilitator CzcD-associated flavoprotein CzcO